MFITFPFLAILFVSAWSKYLYLWQISDIHLDVNYLEDSDPINCKYEGSCCREMTSHQEKHAGKFGSFEGRGWCGMPKEAVQGTLAFIEKKSQDLGIEKILIAYSGDQATQDDEIQTEEDNLNALKQTYLIFEEELTSSPYSLFPALGNHDTWPLNNMHGDLPNKFLSQSAESWKPFLGETELESVQKTGYYTTLIEPGLRIVVLNTLWNSVANKVMGSDKRVVMLKWLEETLQNASENDEKVISVGHVPPGMGGTPGKRSYNYPEYDDQFGCLVNKYSDVILFHLSGHEHVGRFGLVTSSCNSYGSIPYFVGGSVLNTEGESCFWKMNPSVSLYVLDPSDNYRLKDVHVYYNDLIVSNELKDFAKGWDLLFTYGEAYGLHRINTTYLRILIDSLKKNETLLKVFIENYTAKYKNGGCESCDENCKRFLTCQMRYSNHYQFEYCYVKQSSFGLVLTVVFLGILIVCIIVALFFAARKGFCSKLKKTGEREHRYKKMEEFEQQ